MQAKKLAVEAVDDVQDLAAEASAEPVSAQRAAGATPTAGPSPTATVATAGTAAETAHSCRGIAALVVSTTPS